MYWLFREHHMMPGEYYRLPEGDKVVIRAFFSFEMEKRREQG